jgi:hypothetical protein
MCTQLKLVESNCSLRVHYTLLCVCFEEGQFGEFAFGYFEVMVSHFHTCSKEMIIPMKIEEQTDWTKQDVKFTQKLLYFLM